MILGDSLLVMASLAQKEGMKEKVQMIYMDPPYGIKFGSNWQVSTKKRDVKDGKLNDVTRQPEQIRAFRDTWELGIHSYLSYLRDRLVVARDLLTESGSVFVQIGDENVHLVRNLLDEVFGSQNFISVITLRKTGGTTGTFLPGTSDYLIWYTRDFRAAEGRYRPLNIQRQDVEDAPLYQYVQLPDGQRRRIKEGESPDNDLHRYTVLTSQRIRETRTGYFPIDFEGGQHYPTRGEWSTHQQGIRRLIQAGRVAKTGSTLGYVRFLDDFRGVPLTNIWSDLGGAVEPDLEVKTLPDSQLQVELRGVDVYDPTTQEIRNNSTDEVACWFIDTSYNGESFFVRHAYFTGADQPYERLRKALKAEVDEAAWASLYATTSRPFKRPATGKIAVKVINHYGDEVLKVYAV
jgi:adenine-specific DNA-methyltransferase